MTRTLLVVTLLLFGALTAAALQAHGFLGIWTEPFGTWAGRQVFADLAIALALAMAWMWRDARTHGRAAWPWLLATLALGSFGPLLYLLTGRPRRDS